MLQTQLLALKVLQKKNFAKLKSTCRIEFSFVDSKCLDQGIDSEKSIGLILGMFLDCLLV